MSKYLDLVRSQRATLAAEQATLLAELDTLADETRSADAADDARAAEILARLPQISAEDDGLAARETELVQAAERAARAASAPQIVRKPATAAEVAEDRHATPGQIVDAVTRSIEERGEDPSHARGILKRHQRDTAWARNLAVRSTDAYADGWLKAVTGRAALMTADEARAVMSITTNANGGFLVPTHLDPTIILTNSGTSNAIRSLARVETLTMGNVWNGATSAGVTMSWDGEAVEVSDDTPNDIARPSITLHKGAGFVQVTLEADQDIEGLAQQALTLFADARDRLEGAAHATGSGSGQPFGIFTALDANTNVELVSTTAATIGLVDLSSVYTSTPVRFRGNGTWVMNPQWLMAIQALGTAVSASFTTDLNGVPTDRIFGRPVVQSDDAPAVATTTVRDNRIVFGDFSNYVIVDKPGSTAIQYIPTLFNTSNNLPDGRSGWYMTFRSGADSVNDVAFRLLQDKTSA
jgi:HK97 family phage major capsid protein